MAQLLEGGKAAALAPGKLTLVEAELLRASRTPQMSPDTALEYARWILRAEREGPAAPSAPTALRADARPARDVPAPGAPAAREPARLRVVDDLAWSGALARRSGAHDARAPAADARTWPRRGRADSAAARWAPPSKVAARPTPGGLVDPEQDRGEHALERALTLVRADGEGAPLASSVRLSLDAELGEVSARARVHTSSLAAEAAQLLGAQAFTVGRDIYFADGQYAPDTAAGVRLLRHELTHVAQHERGELAAHGDAKVLAPSSAQEAEAHAAEHRAPGVGASTAIASPAGAKNAPFLARPTDDLFSADGRTSAITSTAIARKPGDAPTAIPAGGVNINKVGVVAWDGAPALRLRSARSTGSKILAELLFNSRLQVIKEFPGQWYFVSTQSGLLGYVFKAHVKTNLPEPGAKLHKVKAGRSGFAIAIAEQHYRAHADDWGQDLRFYVNVLAWVNKRPVPDSTAGWKRLQFRAGELIWIPTPSFARSLRGVVNSGSVSYNALDAVGLAGFLERTGELWDDVRAAISLSTKYLPAAIRAHVEESLWSILEAMALLLVGAAAVLAISTAIGAALGALAGGAGAAPGAAAGFEVGLVLLNWLGLGFLIVWLGQSLVKVGGAFGTFLGQIWGARGDAAKVDLAARQFAEAIGTLCGVLIEALVMWAASIGVGRAMGVLRGTRFGKGFQSTAAGEWLTRRVDAVKSGDAALPTPKEAWNKFSWNRTPTAKRLLELFGATASEHFRPIEPNKVSVHGELKISARALDALSDADLVKLVELCKNKGPAEAYAYFESSSTNGGKPGARLRFESRLQERAQQVVDGIRESLGIKPGDARAKLLENLSEGDKLRLWDLFNEQAFKNAQLRKQAAEWALGKKPKTVRELVAQMQFFEAEVSRQGELLTERVREENARLLRDAADAKGGDLSPVEQRNITREVTERILGKALDAIGTAAEKAARTKALGDLNQSSTASVDAAWRSNLTAQTGANAPRPIRLGAHDDATLPAKVQEAGDRLTFGSDADGAYHAHKHIRELGKATDGTNEMSVYLTEARGLLRSRPGTVRHNPNGSRSVVVEAAGKRAIVHVSVEGDATIATFGAQ
ncbi:MAG: DUF4157 domain-containing protein [Kofleriaceae bacterium]